MATAKKIGIWMDHERAQLIEFTDPIQSSMIESKFTHQEKETTIEHGEKRMHNKENHEQEEYYKLLISKIKNYEEVLLFGPTDAKVELHNLLKKDHTTSKIIIEVRNADKMSENQQHAYVKDYFTHHHSVHSGKRTNP